MRNRELFIKKIYELIERVENFESDPYRDFVKGKNVWALRGAWIKTVNLGTHDYSSDELITIEMTVTYDHAEAFFDEGQRFEL